MRLGSAFENCDSLKIVNFGFRPSRAECFAAADLSICYPELEPMNIPWGVKEFYREHFSSTGVSSIFVPAGMKIFSHSWKSGMGIRVDNSTPSDDFAMIRIEQGELKAFRIRDHEKIRTICFSSYSGRAKLNFGY
jgi:hypothetical protein